MGDSSNLVRASEPASTTVVDAKWAARHAAVQQRMRWDRPAGRRQHAITDLRLIQQIRRANGPFKRLLDIVASAAGLVVLAPGFLLVAILVWLSDGGAPFYGHKRVGRQGRDFICWKFRSMHVRGDAILRAHLENNPAAAREWAENRKLKDDPRVTPIGRFLRKTSIDELPQLWNVLKGEMSLVGPRPIVRDELDRYGKDRRFYLVVRPGITGLWQVSGRSDASYERRVQLDREYVLTWSNISDLSILVRTVPAVLKSEGAV